MAVVTEDIIIQEILIRLPIKSMVRCRSVCKSWLAQLYNPNFLFHLNHRRSCSVSLNPPQTDDDDDYLILMNNYYNIETTPSFGLSILSGKNLSETCIIDNYAPYPLSLDSYYIKLVGCINGLVCIAFYFEDIYQFVLWNPTFRLFKKILVPKQPSTSLFLYGFGWDSVTNDYKLITKPYDVDDGEVLSTGVYLCKTDCWSNVNDLSIHDSKFTIWSGHPCVIVNGCPYWYNFLNTRILKFDITSNEFTCLKAPSPSAGIHTNLINLNDCLAYIEYNSYSGAAKVHRYDEQHNVWMRMYTIDRYYMSHNDIKIHCFKYGGEIVFHGKKHLYLYDPKSREIKSRHRSCPRCGACLAKSHKRKRRGGSHDCQGSLRNGFSYTPSLVALPGMKALHDLHL